MGRAVIELALWTPIGRLAAISVLARQDAMARRATVPKLVKLASPNVQRRFVDQIGKLSKKRESVEFKDIFWLALANSVAVDNAWDILRAPAGDRQFRSLERNTNQHYAQALASYELARYKDAVDGFLEVQKREPNELKLNYDYLKAAYSAGKILDKDLATEFFARQFVTLNSLAEDTRDVLRSKILKQIFHDTIATMMPRIVHLDVRSQPKRIGVFFLSSTEALGHAVLDPYHFLALYKDNYDDIFFIGPERASYSPASRVCLDIVEQYGTYLETGSDPLLNLSWMSLGKFSVGPLELAIEEFRGFDEQLNVSWVSPGTRTFGPIELVVENYWSLLREAVQRSRDVADPFQHNAWFMELPTAVTEFGEAFAREHAIDLDRPLVVLHARDRRYHNLIKQSYRDTEISTYLPAIQDLLEGGYQVIRIGDANMSRLDIEDPGYHELPFMEGYAHNLDPFFISRARFMIGCQSGPCAYARVFGVPLLSVNAVLHYTLLPAAMEMVCFKRYFRHSKEGSILEELDLEKALAAGAAHLDNSYQYKIGRFELHDALPEEILASVNDMVAWLNKPSLRETLHQRAFREAVEGLARRVKNQGKGLDLPIGDFIGMSLPGYRISPTVAAMRVCDHDKSGR